MSFSTVLYTCIAIEYDRIWYGDQILMTSCQSVNSHRLLCNVREKLPFCWNPTQWENVPDVYGDTYSARTSTDWLMLTFKVWVINDGISQPNINLVWVLLKIICVLQSFVTSLDAISSWPAKDGNTVQVQGWLNAKKSILIFVPYFLGPLQLVIILFPTEKIVVKQH